MKEISNPVWDRKRCQEYERHLLDFDEELLGFRFKSKRLTRILNWEFWPQKFLYIPVYIYDYMAGIVRLNMVYFAHANPKLNYGGMYASGKDETSKIIPKAKQPNCSLLKKEWSLEDQLKSLKSSGIDYPLILKPDIGDRGILVRKCANFKEAEAYLQKADYDVFAQEYLPEPLEFGIFCMRKPKKDYFETTSITFKKPMHVFGDGRSTVLELIQKHPRLRLFEHPILQRMDSKLATFVPENSERICVVSFGNHGKGCMFLNASELIHSPLSEVMNQLCLEMDEFNYGRFDVRTASIEDLIHGKFRIIELNGALAEPTHIYHPGFSYLKGIGSLLYHHRMLMLIGYKNRKKSNVQTNLFRALRDLRNFRKHESELASRD